MYTKIYQWGVWNIGKGEAKWCLVRTEEDVLVGCYTGKSGANLWQYLCFCTNGRPYVSGCCSEVWSYYWGTGTMPYYWSTYSGGEYDANDEIINIIVASRASYHSTVPRLFK